jgi:hypothetical protein
VPHVKRDLKEVFAEILGEIEKSKILNTVKEFVDANPDYRTYHNKGKPEGTRRDGRDDSGLARRCRYYRRASFIGESSRVGRRRIGKWQTSRKKSEIEKRSLCPCSVRGHT